MCLCVYLDLCISRCLSILVNESVCVCKPLQECVVAAIKKSEFS